MQTDLRFLICIYANPLHYPSTYNTIKALKKRGHVQTLCITHDLTLKSNPIFEDDYSKLIQVRSQTGRNLSLIRRIQKIYQYTKSLRNSVVKFQPDYVIIHDSLPLLSLYILLQTRRIQKNFKIWYHNHDVPEKNRPKFDLIKASILAERSLFPKIDIFTLPSEERKQYFDLSNFVGKYFTIPNYPSVNYCDEPKTQLSSQHTINLVYQGRIGPGHGLDLCAEICNAPVQDLTVNLHIIGQGDLFFLKEKIEKTIKDQNRFFYHGFIEHGNLKAYTTLGDIGIAILDPEYGTNFLTAATASNKIYEYAACGLPVIYMRSPGMLQHLKDLPWAIPADMNIESIKSAITYIHRNYERLSDLAIKSIRTDLNFEKRFEMAFKYAVEVYN
ncbi:MAG: glycosyltransferase [Flavobacteriales bacterium]|nr:glycosyltransferase [Flavobacteriales bacterium]